MGVKYANLENTSIGDVVLHNNQGYNPVGVLTAPAIPASGTAHRNTFPVDATVFVTGGTVSGVSVGGAATGMTAGDFRVKVGQTITLSYTAAPSWVWIGD